MNIKLTSDEASFIVGVLAVWKVNTKWEREQALIISITEKIFAEDKKDVDKVLKGGEMSVETTTNR